MQFLILSVHIEELVSTADYVIASCTLTPSTKGNNGIERKGSIAKERQYCKGKAVLQRKGKIERH